MQRLLANITVANTNGADQLERAKRFGIKADPRGHVHSFHGVLDACRLATSMREFAKPEYATTRTAEWENWKKLCARLTALLIEIRARWYGGVL